MRTPARRSLLFALALLAIGFALRLAFGSDIEFKADEAYNFGIGQRLGAVAPWVWTGMSSSAGIPNPGLSAWVFAVLTRIFSVTTPVGLARSVQLCNCGALAILAAYGVSRADDDSRRLWIWSAALAAVNPLEVILQRKIWAPSVIPLFSVLFMLAWLRRDKRFTGAFSWGLLGSLLGQVHMAGFFYAAAVLIWTLFFDRWRKVAWRWWIGGSLIGLVPLAPWVIAVVRSLSHDASYFKWVRLVMFKYWNYWIVGAFGTNISYSIGDNLYRLMRYPIIGGVPFFLVGLAQVFLCLSACWVLFHLARRWVTLRGRWKELFFGTDSETSLLISAAFFGTGILMTLSAVSVQNHYLLVTFPVQFLWLSRACLRIRKIGERLLLCIFVAQLTVSAGFLWFIHQNGGAPGSAYGTAYGCQLHPCR